LLVILLSFSQFKSNILQYVHLLQMFLINSAFILAAILDFKIKNSNKTKYAIWVASNLTERWLVVFSILLHFSRKMVSHRRLGRLFSKKLAIFLVIFRSYDIDLDSVRVSQICYIVRNDYFLPFMKLFYWNSLPKLSITIGMRSWIAIYTIIGSAGL
jgi:hypothetical protein